MPSPPAPIKPGVIKVGFFSKLHLTFYLFFDLCFVLLNSLSLLLVIAACYFAKTTVATSHIPTVHKFVNRIFGDAKVSC